MADETKAPTTEETKSVWAEDVRTARERNDPVARGSAYALRAYALPIAEHRDALAAEVARLRPLAELGALALAWGRACVLVGVARDRRRADGYMVETEGPTLAQQVNNETDARVALRFASMRMAKEER